MRKPSRLDKEVARYLAVLESRESNNGITICANCVHIVTGTSSGYPLCNIWPVTRDPVDGAWMYKRCCEANKDGNCGLFEPKKQEKPGKPKEKKQKSAWYMHVQVGALGQLVVACFLEAAGFSFKDIAVFYVWIWLASFVVAAVLSFLYDFLNKE